LIGFIDGLKTLETVAAVISVETSDPSFQANVRYGRIPRNVAGDLRQKSPKLISSITAALGGRCFKTGSAINGAIELGQLAH
jgi:hypothetical protein